MTSVPDHRSAGRRVWLAHAAGCLIALLLGASQAWTYRLDISSEDSVSYLDLSDAWMKGDLSHVANGYWSPLYPALIGATRLVLARRLPGGDFALLKLINFAIYTAALAAFTLLLTRLRGRRSSSQDGAGDWVAVAAAYMLFIWTEFRWTGTWVDTPDLCVAALTFLAAGLVLDLRQKASWRRFAALGLVLGFAYLAKAVMLPVGVTFLVAAWCAVRPRRSATVGIGLAALIFALVSLPQVIAVSRGVHRLSFGESGRLNYIWYVSPRAADHHWQTVSAESNGPRLPHPTRPLSQDPPAFEFASPLGGTYPPWYDPSYWYEGFDARIDWMRQAAVIYRNVRYDFLVFGAFIAIGWLVLGAVSETGWSLAGIVRHPLLIPTAAGLAACALGTDLTRLRGSDLRLVAPFVVLASVVVFSPIKSSSTVEAHRVRVALLIGLLLLFAADVLDPAKRLAPHPTQPEANEQAQVASDLLAFGVCAGDAVAHVGIRGYGWARLARVRIVAEVPDSDAWWAASVLARDRVMQALRATGAAAVVERPDKRLRDTVVDPGWQSLPNTSGYIYVFRPRAGGC